MEMLFGRLNVLLVKNTNLVLVWKTGKKNIGVHIFK